MNELVATCWTHAGDAAPMRGDERSPVPILDRIDGAARAGFAGFGLVHADLVAARDTIGWDGLSSAIQAAGFGYTEVEFLTDWWATGTARQGSDAVRRDLLEAAHALEARFIKVSGSVSTEPPGDRLAESWNELCEQAAGVGTRIALEPLPFTNFRTITEGASFVQGVGHPAGGIIIDVWHVYRGGQCPEDLLDAVKLEHLFGAELDDAYEPAPDGVDLAIDTINNRVPPGEGDWDIPGFINVLRSIGFDGPWGVELISESQRRLPLERALEVAYESGMWALAEADRRR